MKFGWYTILFCKQKMQEGREFGARNAKTGSTRCCRRSLLGTLLYILVLLLLLLVIITVVIPMAFKYSVGIQQSIIFPTFIIHEKDYSNIKDYKISGVRNFYIDTNDSKIEQNVTLGIWQILPKEMLSEFINNDEYNFDGALMNKKYNILLYLHGNGNDRTGALPLYNILRKYFHIFAVDYRGYGDSTKAEMREEYIVHDLAYIYKWLRSRSNSRIFVWGHSLGTGVGTQLIANLKAQNYTPPPSGLILETPFTSVTDVMKEHPVIKAYSYLPWCKATFLDPIVDNGMDFDSKKYILDVDCPIMILHAKDDTVIPYEIATQLYNIAVNNRNSTFQGNVTYHLYDALGYDHMDIYMAPQLPEQVRTFIEECIDFEGKKSH